MMMPFSALIVLLNFADNRFMGESICSLYTCHMVRVTGSSGFSFDPSEQPVKAEHNISLIKKVDSSFFIRICLVGIPPQAAICLPVKTTRKGLKKHIRLICPINSGVLGGDKIGKRLYTFIWNRVLRRGQSLAPTYKLDPDFDCSWCRTTAHHSREHESQVETGAIPGSDIRNSNLNITESWNLFLCSTGIRTEKR